MNLGLLNSGQMLANFTEALDTDQFSGWILVGGSWPYSACCEYQQNQLTAGLYSLHACPTCDNLWQLGILDIKKCVFQVHKLHLVQFVWSTFLNFAYENSMWVINYTVHKSMQTCYWAGTLDRVFAIVFSALKCPSTVRKGQSAEGSSNTSIQVHH